MIPGRNRDGIALGQKLAMAVWCALRGKNVVAPLAGRSV
jgi:hypothetical protein